MAELPEQRTVGDSAPADDAADRVTLMAALAELAPLDRTVVVLRFWHDLSVSTTATDLHLTESAVKSRSIRALRRLRDLLADDIDIPRSTR
jgi:DNA-directed RNA polymerase specialized sigma24 family protein